MNRERFRTQQLCLLQAVSMGDDWQALHERRSMKIKPLVTQIPQIYLLQYPFSPSLSHVFVVFVCETHKDKSRDVITGFQAYIQCMTFTIQKIEDSWTTKCCLKISQILLQGICISTSHPVLYSRDLGLTTGGYVIKRDAKTSTWTGEHWEGVISEGWEVLYGPRCHNWDLI